MKWVDQLAARFGYYTQDYLKTQLVSVPEWLRATGEAEQFSVPERHLPEAQLELYQRLAWVQIAVSNVANRGATAGFEVKRLEGEKRIGIANHPFEQLLMKPNPLMSRFELLVATLTMYDVTGHGFWWLNKASPIATPDEIWMLPTNKVRPVPDRKMYLQGYLYEPDGASVAIPLDVHEVVHFRRFHPLNSFVGLSPIEALATDAQADLSMQKWNANYFDKGHAKVPGALAFADPVDPESWSRLKADVEEQHGGTKRKMMMLRGVGKGGVQWINMAISQKEMEFLEGRNFTKEEIYSIYAPGLASILAVNATEANSKAGLETFIGMGVWPLLVALGEKITNDVLPLYGPNLIGEFEDIRPKDRAMALQEQTAFERVHTVDEVRAKFYDGQPIGDDRGRMLVVEVGKGSQQSGVNSQESAVSSQQPAVNGDQQSATNSQQLMVNEDVLPVKALTAGALKAGAVKMQRGVMVAFFAPAVMVAELTGLQRRLPMDCAPVAANELHVTLFYCGEMGDLSSEQVAALVGVLAKFAGEMPPVRGVINGVGRFQNDGLTDAVYATFDSAGLQEWRLELARRLTEAGIPNASDHGYIPHVTLAYVEADTVMPIMEFSRTEVVFDRVWLAFGDARQSWMLEGVEVAGEGDQPLINDSMVGAKRDEARALKRWLKRRPHADGSSWDNRLLSAEEVAVIVAEVRGVKAKKLPGLDGQDDVRAAMEVKHAERIAAALRKVMRSVVPAGTTPENITPDLAWQRYQQNSSVLRDAMVAMLLEAATLGAKTGFEQVEYAMGFGRKDGSKAQIGGVNWDLVNQEVLDWLLGGGDGQVGTGYGDTVTTALGQTAEPIIRAQVGEWIRNGLPMQQLIDSLMNTVFYEGRAQMIATTEVTRAYAWGNRAAWRESGIIQRMEWQTSADERVCAVCGPLRGRVVTVNGEFEGGMFPPAHPRCRCWVVPVVEG